MTDTAIKLLSIESAGTLCSVAVAGFGKNAFISSEPGQKHTSVILGMIRNALQEASGSLDSLDAIVFGAGPGAFTGLRVACGMAQGIGWALNKKLIAVNNLLALAYRQINALKEEDSILVSTDARMHECYTAVFTKRGERLVERVPAFLSAPEDLVRHAEESNCSGLCGNAFAAYPVEIPPALQLLSTEDANAEMLLVPALIEYGQDKLITPEQAGPLYVRNHVAQTIEERKKIKEAKSS